MTTTADLSDAAERSPMAIPIFRAIWFASMASNFGGLIQVVGASWLMTSLTESSAMVALVQSSTALPLMLLSLWAGAIADNFDRRRVMLIAQAFMLIVSAALTYCAWSGAITPWSLLAFTFLVGCGSTVSSAAWQASVRDMVGRKAVPAAVALNSTGYNIARSAGPSIGGVIVAAAGASAAFLANSISYLGLIAVLLRWRPQLPAETLPREPIGSAMMAGLRYMAMSPSLLIVLLRAAALGLSASAAPALMPLVAHDLLAGGPMTYGALLGAYGIGAVIGALSSAWLRQHFSAENVVRGGTLVLAGACAVAGLSHSTVLTFMALLVVGASWLVVLSVFNVTIQMDAPRWVGGRAQALFRMATFGGVALGSWIAGAIAGANGVGEALLVAAGMQASAILLGFWLPLRGINLNLDPLHQPAAPQTSMPVEPRSGPIAITIEYRIPPDRVDAFVAAMAERKRIRLRDGARLWNLLHDLNDSELWIERYHVPTWVDYLRHTQRRTQADKANFDQIRQLHAGPDGPVVRRMIERQPRSVLGSGNARHEEYVVSDPAPMD